MVESICGQGFAYTREAEEDRQRSSQTRTRKYYKRQRRRWLKQFSVLDLKTPAPTSLLSFVDAQHEASWSKKGFRNFIRARHAATNRIDILVERWQRVAWLGPDATCEPG
jgi:hypothetical protein